MKKRIVVTGRGAFTPIGPNVEAYWQNLLAGHRGIRDITRIDASSLPVKSAGEIPDFNPRDYLNVKLSTDMDLFMQFAFIAAEEALRESQMVTHTDRTGVVMGSALGGISLTAKTQDEFSMENKPVSPRFLSKELINIAGAQLAIQYGLSGPCMTVTTACSTGGDVINLAWLLLRSGAADTIVAMAGESPVSAVSIHSLASAGALSKSGDSRPFDRERDGFVMGEGGGALILETEEHALRRGAPIFAEILGCANNTDAFHVVAPKPDGSGAAACMRIALETAGLTPGDIGYVNAHGTATVKGDLAESLGLRAVFADYAVPVSSTKGHTGHMMAAGGITEVITCMEAIRTGILPYTLHCDEKDEQCGLNLIMHKPLHARIDTAMSNAFGFGGQNSSIIVGRYLP